MCKCIKSMCVCMAKYMLFILNLIFWVAGGVMLGVGIALAVDDDIWDWMNIMLDTDAGMNDDLLAIAVYMLIGIGSLIFLVGFLGCAGACCMNKCMLTSYVGLVILILVLELTAGILVIIFKSEIDEEIKIGMQNDVKHKYGEDEPYEGYTAAWDSMQVELKCCGSVGYKDYENSLYYNDTKNEVPWSCCVLNNGQDKPDEEDVKNYDQCKTDARNNLNNSTYLHTVGCYNEMKSWFDNISDIVIIIVFCILGVQIVGLILGCCLEGQISHKNDDYTV